MAVGINECLWRLVAVISVLNLELRTTFALVTRDREDGPRPIKYCDENNEDIAVSQELT